MILATLALAALLSSARVVPPVVPIDPAVQVVALVNAERQAQHLDPLTISVALSRSAQRYADQMAASGVFSHVGQDGSTVATRAAAEGYDGQVGETIAAGQLSAGDVVHAWMTSPSHRLTLLSPWARATGVGVARSDSGPYRAYWIDDVGTVAPAEAPVFLSKEYVEAVLIERAQTYRINPTSFVALARCESHLIYNARGDRGSSRGVLQINDRGSLAAFHRAGGIDPDNVYEAATFGAREIAAGRGGQWSCFWTMQGRRPPWWH